MPALAPLAAVPPNEPNRRDSAGRSVVGGRLASTVLGHLPLGVAVINADARLLFWNEHAAHLFGVPSAMAPDMPHLGEILERVANLTRQQRDGIVDFVTTHIAAGDRTEPESCLRISLGRDRRIAIQVRGIGSGRWMMIIDDGKMAVAAGRDTAAQGDGVAWLDALTGLSNRRQFNQALRDLVANASSDSRHALLMVDLDRFKLVNETLGHPIGDALLCIVAQRLRREIREEDLLARLGGDEFAILMANGERAERLATRVVDVLSRPLLVEGHIAKIGASVGIARLPEHGSSADDLVRYAEMALYDAKSAGRRTWRVFEPAMAAEAEARRDLETALRRALDMSELSLVYQARWDIQTQQVTGFDALLRWDHPILGDVSPVLFMPVAEEIGGHVGMGEWTFQTACKEAARWPAPVYVVVSISPRQLESSERLFKAIQAALKSSGLAPERLELKITESSLLSSAPHVVEMLPRLRACGVRIAMDEFGIGHPSMSRFRSFPFNKIKADQDFIDRHGIGADAAAEIRAIAALAAGYGMASIAEGDEPADKTTLAGADGSSDTQGDPPSLPIHAVEIDALLRRYVPASTSVSKTE